MQMDFGKNRVQYKEFVWQFYRQKKFDTYFYVGGKNLAEFATNIADTRIKQLESYFGYNFQKRIIFLIYNNLSDFRQSNIGFVSSSDQYNIGGTTRVVDNKVFIYFDGDHEKFKKQINSAIAEVMVNEMLYGSDFTARMTNSTLLTLPEWYYKGLISYLSEEWSVETENFVKDGILSGKYQKFNRLSGNDAVYAGHSIWYFVAQKYGKSVIPNILYLTRISKNSESGFLYVIGLPIKYLSFEWLNFYDEKYYNDEQKRSFPESNKMLKKTKKNRVYQHESESSDENYIAFVTNEIGKVKLYLLDVKTNKKRCIFKFGQRLDQITDYSYPLLAWHPSGKILSFIVEQKGSSMLYFYDVADNTLDSKEMFNIDKIVDYSYSKDGLNFVLSAVKDGQTDIYVFNNAANTYNKITNDFADDRYPQFINNSEEIIFSSNRTNDTLGISNETNLNNSNYNIFIYNLKNKSNVLSQITNTKYDNETMPFQLKKNEYTFLSDQNGIINRCIAKYDSTITFIDTTTHYSYFTNINQITNYSRNILEQNVTTNNNKFSEIIYKDGKYHLFSNKIESGNSTEILQTGFKKNTIKQFEIADSIQKSLANAVLKADTVVKKIKLNTDSNKIDINNYIFEFQKNKQKGYLPKSDSTLKVNKDTTTFNFHPMIYLTSFYTNTVTTQIDFGFLSNSYQTFTGGPFYFNPGFNVFFKLGTSDLFEDYRITGGVRFAGNFNSNEYLLSFENLKYKLDKQFVFHRLALNFAMGNDLIKTHTHELFYILKYPFNQVMSLKFTTNVRNDRSAYLSTELSTLQKIDVLKTWLGEKVEFIYDNTRNRGLNLYWGTRSKVFFEAYDQVNNIPANLFVYGLDFRHYQKIHRDLIWASRIAASSSFGTRKLIYYLGSVDNWVNLSTKVQTFDQSVLIDYTQNYVYQAVATNMRGFTQNIRNGNSFAVINNEIRWPIVKYFMNRPIHSDFFENFQIISFFDIGTAWSGKSPNSKQNAYNKEIVENGPITIVIDKDRQPIVYGYGFGLRSRLLGYFVRADWAWGIENNTVLPNIFYLSLSLDF